MISSTATAVTTAHGPLRSRIRTAALATAVFTYAWSMSLLMPVLPTLATAFHTSGPATTWATTAFTLTSAIATVLVGRLGDLYGHRRVLTVILGTGSAGLALAAAADSLTTLVIGRSLAGIGTAALPLAFALVRRLEPPDRARADIGLLSTVTGLGAAGGWVLAGPLITLGGPAPLSLLPLALSALALAGIRFTISTDPPPAAISIDRRLDLVGAIGLALWLTALLLSCAQGGHWGWTSPGVLALSAVGLLGAAAWARYELGCLRPLIDLRAHCSPALLTTGGSALACGYAFVAAGIAVPVLVQAPATTGFGLAGSATDAGMVQLPTGLALMAAGTVAGRAVTRHGERRVLAAGCAVITTGCLISAVLHGSLAPLVVGNTLRGVGLGLAYAAMSALTVRSVPDRDSGAAAGVNVLLRNLGTAVGGELTAVILLPGTPAAMTIAFTVPCVAMALTTAVLLLRTRHHGAQPQ